MLRRLSLLVIKLVVTIAALWWVFSRIDKQSLLAVFQQLSPLYLLISLLLYNLAQIISALRLRFYDSTHTGSRLKLKTLITYYYRGMFLNLALPGGIGGDGYLAYWLTKNRNIPLKTSIRMLLSTRASGLLFLCALALFIAALNPSLILQPFKLWLIPGFIVLIASYSLLSRILLKEPFTTQSGAAPYSFCVQGLAVCIGCCLLNALGIQDHITDYLLLLMVGNIAALAPIALFGGIGLRELVFLYGSAFLNIAPEPGISLSIAYFLVTLISSFAGLFFWYRKDPHYASN